MQHVTPDALLRAWEIGTADSRPSARSRALLGVVGVDGGATEPDSLTVGRCDDILVDLRVRLFGSRFEAWVPCPACGQGLELEFDAADLKTPITSGNEQRLALRVGDYSLICKVPCIADMASLERLDSSEERRADLLARTVLEASISGTPCTAAELPQNVTDMLERALEERDGQIVTEVVVNCEACGHQWRASFDIVAYLWIELERWATRLLWEVSVLARAFGWKELELVMMSPWRRQRYLEILGR